MIKSLYVYNLLFWKFSPFITFKVGLEGLYSQIHYTCHGSYSFFLFFGKSNMEHLLSAGGMGCAWGHKRGCIKDRHQWSAAISEKGPFLLV